MKNQLQLRIAIATTTIIISLLLTILDEVVKFYSHLSIDVIFIFISSAAIVYAVNKFYTKEKEEK